MTATRVRPPTPVELPAAPRPQRVPRPLLAVAGVVLACCTVMMFVGGWRTGVSWDETYHVLRMRNYLGPSGWYLLDGDLDGTAPGSWEDQAYVYAPMTMLLLHGWSLLWGVDGSGSVSATATAYAVRHVGVGLLALPALAATAALARMALRERGWALVAAASLAAMPAWTGHAMFNVKDVPVASGYTLVTLGLALLVTGERRRTVVAGAVATAAGIGLAVGTRPGIWPGLALAALAAVVLVPRADRAVRLVALAAAVVVGGGLVALVYPAPFGSPYDALTGSVLESSRFGGITVSRGYIPVYLVAEVPTLLLVLGALGAVLAAGRVWRARGGDPARAVLVLVLLQAFALPVLAIARGSNLYNGLRQLLFAYPALAVLVTVGVAGVLGFAARRRGTWLRVGVPVAVGAALVAPTVVQLQLFPYNYAYASVPAALLAPSVGERWPEYALPTDYWRTSVRELAPEIPRGGFVMCQPNSDGEGHFMRWSNDGRDDCATSPIGPLAPYDGQRTGSWPAPQTQFLAVVSGTDAIGDNCTRLADVTRPRYWQRVTMSYVARCDLVVPDYPAGGLTFGDGGNGWPVLLGGWASHHGDPGVGVEGGAELGFVLPAWARGRPLVLDVTAVGASGLSLAVNGVPARPAVDGDTLRVRVPAAVAGRAGEDRLLVTVTDRDGGARLLSLGLEEGAGR